MKKFQLSESGARGWFIGDFPEAVFRTKNFEVNWQSNAQGHEKSHYHKIITEIRLITKGQLLLNGEIFKAGEIAVLEPGEIAQQEYLEDTDSVTIKFPSLPDDKYYLHE